LYRRWETKRRLLVDTPHAAVARAGVYYNAVLAGASWLCSSLFSFNDDGKNLSPLPLSPEHLWDHLLYCSSIVGSKRRSFINFSEISDGLLINAPTLAYLMEQCKV
jgi:hypothetical protein